MCFGHPVLVTKVSKQSTILQLLRFIRALEKNITNTFLIVKDNKVCNKWLKWSFGKLKLVSK